MKSNLVRYQDIKIILLQYFDKASAVDLCMDENTCCQYRRGMPPPHRALPTDSVTHLHTTEVSGAHSSVRAVLQGALPFHLHPYRIDLKRIRWNHRF